MIQSASQAEGVTFHSFSSVNTYVSICPLQYRFRYVERRTPERRSSTLVFGSAVNDALVSIDADLIAGRAPNLAHALDVFEGKLAHECSDSAVPVEFPEGESFDSLLEKGKRMIGHYLSQMPPDERPRPAEERRFAVPLIDPEGRVLGRFLVGEFDRVLDAGGGSRGIVDWKTAAKRWSQNDLDSDLQSTVYRYAAQMTFGSAPVFFRYDLLLKTKDPAIERYYVDRTERDTRRFLRLVQEVDRALEAGVFPPRDKSWSCAGCAFRDACRRWQD